VAARFVLAYLAVAGSVSALAIVAIVSRHRAQLEAEVEKKGDAVTRLFCWSVTTPLYHLDVDRLQSEIGHVKQLDDVTAALVADVQGRCVTDGTDENPRLGDVLPEVARELARARAGSGDGDAVAPSGSGPEGPAGGLRPPSGSGPEGPAGGLRPPSGRARTGPAALDRARVVAGPPGAKTFLAAVRLGGEPLGAVRVEVSLVAVDLQVRRLSWMLVAGALALIGIGAVPVWLLANYLLKPLLFGDR
jgi:hypothetical protein